MFTVKVVFEKEGREVLLETHQVLLDCPPPGNKETKGPFVGNLSCDVVTPKGIQTVTYPVRRASAEKDAIKAYVMNGAGNTVATYYL